jgi:single-stranded DNA-binding protein
MPRDAIDGFSFEGQGTLDRIDEFTSKAGKTIPTLVIRVGGQWPQLVPVKVFGRCQGSDESEDWQPGVVLRIEGRLGGRDWNGKVYGDIVASSVRIIGQGSSVEKQAQSAGATPSNFQPNDDSVPF